MLDLARAQGSVREAAGTPFRSAATPQQQRLLAALEGYAVALADHGHPMPYRMRSELAMYRAMSIPLRGHTR